MSDLPAEIFPERVGLEVLGSDPPVTAICAMASFSDRGITLTTTDNAVVSVFPAGTKVHGSYGDHSGFCQFDSEVWESLAGATDADPGVIRVLPPTQIVTTQRRRFVRAAVEVEIACALLDTKAMAFRSAPGEVRNLGGGGLMMIIAAHPALKEGSELALAIPAPGGGPVLALGRTIEAVPTPDGPLQLRLAFTTIDPIGRERIERFVYRRVGGVAAAKLWSAGKITLTQE